MGVIVIKLSKKAKDITGWRYGKLVCIEPFGKNKFGRMVWRCLCDCGKYKNINGGDLGSGKVNSCGCLYGENYRNLVGEKFNRLFVLKLHKKIKYPNGGTDIIWRCLCDCGNITYKASAHLVAGTIKSCGCLRDEVTKNRCLGVYGKNHPAWTGNNIDRRTSVAYLNWRKTVFTKNNYTCILCEQYGGTLNIHHLDGYNWCIAKRMDINNGITLCKRCHIKFHKIYGKGKNTYDQFVEYINL